jgi:triphosphoribosyl-dephospho-CoA synthase
VSGAGQGGAVDPVVRRAFVEACHAELRALKPGNVHDHAPGHRMTVADFEASAAAAAPWIARTGLPVGERVRGAMAATFDAVGQNTNLGILLLAAPLAVAVEGLGEPASPEALRAEVGAVIDRTTVADAAAVYEAIRIANPGGLGTAGAEDVSAAPTVTLKAAMALAADRDRIARQYVTTFADVFGIGLSAHRRATLTQRGAPMVTTAVFFAFAAAFPDTHVVRKFGRPVADALQAQFAERSAFADDLDLERLRIFDRELKDRGVNPGTSADLTVATEFTVRLLGNK